MPRRPSQLSQFGPALRILALFSLLLGLAYPLSVTGIGRALFPGQAAGSLVSAQGHVVGSALLGQSFTGDARYFQSRPSAAGTGYDPLASGASNLALDSPELIAQVRERRAAAAHLDGVSPDVVPADALLASGSGLDPQISPAYAAEQIDRVARIRGLPVSGVRSLVAAHTQGRTFGFLGEPRVDVLELNIALDQRADRAGRLGR